jgi:hypothetical protein
MIDNSRKFKTYEEHIAYHHGWMDGMETAREVHRTAFEEIKDDLVRDEVDDTKEDRFKGSKEDINEH